MRVLILAVSGTPFTEHTVFLVYESYSYVFTRQGWFLVTLIIGSIFLISRHLILNIIVAFLRRSINQAEANNKNLLAKVRAKVEEDAKMQIMKHFFSHNIFICCSNVVYLRLY